MKKDFNKSAAEAQPMCGKCKLPVEKNHKCIQVFPYRRSVGM